MEIIQYNLNSKAGEKFIRYPNVNKDTSCVSYNVLKKFTVDSSYDLFIRVLYANIPLSFPNINYNNYILCCFIYNSRTNIFYTFDVYLKIGYYDIDSFGSMLKEQINLYFQSSYSGFSGLNLIDSVTYLSTTTLNSNNPNGWYFTFSTDVDSFFSNVGDYPVFGISDYSLSLNNVQTTSNELIGIDFNVNLSSTTMLQYSYNNIKVYTTPEEINKLSNSYFFSNVSVDLSYTKSIGINILNSATAIHAATIVNVVDNNLISSIPINSNFPGFVNYRDCSNSWVPLSMNKLDTFYIYLTDDYQRQIYLNNANYEISIQIQFKKNNNLSSKVRQFLFDKKSLDYNYLFKKQKK